MSIIQLQSVNKGYLLGQVMQPVLYDISLIVSAGEFVAIVGPSGNGKSTLLNLLTGIDRPCSGQVRVCGSALQNLKEEQLSVWRGTNVGIVFQFFNYYLMLRSPQFLQFCIRHLVCLDKQLCPQCKMVGLVLNLQTLQLEHRIDRHENVVILGNGRASWRLCEPCVGF